MTPDELSKTDLFVLRNYWLRKQGQWGPWKLAAPTLLPGVILFWICAIAAQKSSGRPNAKSVMIFVLGLVVLLGSLIAMFKATRVKFERWLAPISQDQLPQLWADISKFMSERAAKRRRS